MNRSWSVVIPSDRPRCFMQAARSVLETHERLNPERIILATGEIKAKDLDGDLKDVRIVHDDEPFKFARRVNLGFDKADEDDVVIMGDDVRMVHAGTVNILKDLSPLRLLAPAVTGRVGPPWQKEGQAWPMVPFISFTCLYVPRELYRVVGPLEEDFPGYGYEDTDYCIRVNQAGFSCGVAAVTVRHSVDAPSHFLQKWGHKIVQLEAEAEQAFYEKHRRRIQRPFAGLMEELKALRKREKR